MPSTALQMVNRVLRKGRQDPVSGFSSSPGDVILDLVNEAAMEIFESFEWPFLRRNDYAIPTIASWTGTTLTITNGSTDGSFPKADTPGGIEDVTGSQTQNIVSRLVVTEDATYGNTSLQISNASEGATNIDFKLEEDWPGTSFSGDGDYRVYIAEYLLPATVGSIYSVLHEEQPLRLTEIDEEWSFNRLEPRWHENLGEPEHVFVGGTAQPSWDTALGTPPDRQQRLVVWPIPDAVYLLRVSYKQRYAALSSTTDDFDGTPEYIINDIVELAYVKANLSGVFNDREMGLTNRRILQRTLREHFDRANPNKRRMPVLSLDRRGSTGTAVGRLPEDRFE